MQVQLSNRLLMIVNWIMAMIGFQLVTLDHEWVHEGWRQIPDGHQSFDPALAEHFKTLKMRNGKHINLAVSYSVVAKWNSSNKRRGIAEWTYGSDRHYADKYTDVDRKTWGQHMEDLAALGLVEVSQMKGKPAYRVVPYQILNDQLCLVHAQGYGHDAQKVAHDAQGYGHDAHPIMEVSKKELSGKRNDLKPAAPTREDAGAADPSDSTTPEKSLIEKTMPSVKVEAVVKADDIRGTLSLPGSPIPSVPPVSLSRIQPPPPPSPASDGGSENCPEDDDLKAFFNGCSAGELAAMVTRYGRERIQTIIDEVRLLPNVDNPPGMVRTKLRLGALGVWKWPTPRFDDADGAKYINGPYAHIINH